MVIYLTMKIIKSRAEAKQYTRVIVRFVHNKWNGQAINQYIKEDETFLVPFMNTYVLVIC